MKLTKFKVNKYLVKITGFSSPLPTWYEIGDEFWSEYDPYLGSFVARGNGAGGRCIPVEDCKVIEDKVEFLTI